MKILSTLCILLVCLACSGCDSDTAVPTSPEEEQPLTGFHIKRLLHDSLYWGERAFLLGEDFGSNADSLKLFLHTSRVAFTVLSESLIEFEVPSGAQSGALRLYRGKQLPKVRSAFTLSRKNSDHSSRFPAVFYLQLPTLEMS